MKIPKPVFTPEFRDRAVKRVKAGETAGVVAKELGLVEQTLRNWVKAAARGNPNEAGSRTVTPEEMELSRLRAGSTASRMSGCMAYVMPAMPP
ncbi:MAG: Transposase [Candidatus Accumulibacter vicinus]|uniref:Transposase n=1 Tax=Candidatus Accumulibacter vicinus TaxID=2954382 RepID=A0A084Y0T4_9PROT|nr:MAG: Transposase [Candidatus Accumulibacter vicinus]